MYTYAKINNNKTQINASHMKQSLV